MGSKHPDRRDFLKRGAALAGGLTLGGAGGLTLGGAEHASGQTPEAGQDLEVQDWSSPELIADGERSRRAQPPPPDAQAERCPDEHIDQARDGD